MKIVFRIQCSIFALAILADALAASAQQYAIDWLTIDGGGGSGTNGQYGIAGTIGQPDGGGMSGGSYMLDGGFWGIIAAIQTPGSPVLRGVLTSTNTVVVAWPAPSASFALQENADLATTNWVSVTNAVNVVGSENQVTISPPLGNRFYRLKYP